MHVLIQLQKAIRLHKKTSKCELNFNLNQTNSWCINYNQCIQKIKIKLRMKAINFARSKLEGKVTRSVKKNNELNSSLVLDEEN